MNTLRVFVAGIPQPNPKLETTSGTTKAGKRYTRVFQRDKDGKKRAWMKEVAYRVRLEMNRRSIICRNKDYWVRMNLTFILPRPTSAKKRLYPNVKPDRDNLAYAVENALKGVLYEDDAMVCFSTQRKLYTDPLISDRTSPGVLIEVEWGLNRE